MNFVTGDATIEWEPKGYERDGKFWKAGTLVYLQWDASLAPSKRIVLAVGKVTRRFVGALLRLEPSCCPGDNKVVMLCELADLVKKQTYKQTKNNNKKNPQQ